MTKTTVSACAPAHWASYLINGDGSGLDPNDCDKAEQFAHWLLGYPWRGEPIWTQGEEFFAHRHDATQFGIGGAMCIYYCGYSHE